MHGKHGICILYPNSSIRACALKIEFDDAERLSGRSDDNRTQKFSNYVPIQKIRSKNKVAFAVELSILCIRITSPCNVYLPPHTLLYSKTGVHWGIHYFLKLLFALKHR